MTYKNFKKFESSPVEEKSILILIRLHAVITDAVDNLSKVIENTERVILQIPQDKITVS